MIITKNKRKAAPPRRRQDFSDPWSDWKPQWGDRAAPHGVQERHSPTESVTHQEREGEEVRAQRRVVDARLWEAMSPEQQDAACAIALAVESMGRGLGYAASKWDGMPRTGGACDAGVAHMRLVNVYVGWTKACHRNKISHAMIADVLAQGHSCAEVDRTRRVRKGTARQNLFDGLTLYCVLRGWIGRSSTAVCRRGPES